MALHSILTYRKAWSYSDSLVVSPPVNSGVRLKISVYGTISNVLQLPYLSSSLDHRIHGIEATPPIEPLVPELLDVAALPLESLDHRTHSAPAHRENLCHIGEEPDSMRER